MVYRDLTQLVDKVDQQPVFQGEFDPAVSCDTQEFSLLSGIQVRGVLMGVQLLMMDFQFPSISS